MKGTAQKVLILAVGTIVFVLIAGCQEQELTDAKKSRLVAAEDIELKKELEKRSREIKRQEELLTKCQEEKKLRQEKADENIGLKKELEQRGREIERIKEQHSKEIKRQEALLAKCREEKKLWQEKADRNVKGQMEELSEFIVEVNSTLQEENESLKAQIEKLKAELAGKQQGEKPKE